MESNIKERLINICLIAGLMAFAIHNYRTQGLFYVLGVDYRAWWSVAQIAKTDFSQVYQPSQLIHWQQMLDVYGEGWKGFELLPASYLPVYFLPLLPLTMLGPENGCLSWIALNAIGLSAYLWYYLKRANCQQKELLWLSCLASIPFFLNLLFAQVSGLAMIAVGEFLWHYQQNDSRRAGLWLALWLIKPFCLILILPRLIFDRQWRLLGYFSALVVAQLLISACLIGQSGIDSYMFLLSHFKNSYGNWPETMSNWRMIGLHTQLPGLAAIGTLITAGLALASGPLKGPRYPLRCLALLSATLVCSWHVREHTWCILLPAWCLAAQTCQMRRIFWTWSAFPTAFFLLMVLIVPSFTPLSMFMGRSLCFRILTWLTLIWSLMLVAAPYFMNPARDNSDEALDPAPE